MNGRMDRWMDRWMDGRTDGHILILINLSWLIDLNWPVLTIFDEETDKKKSHIRGRFYSRKSVNHNEPEVRCDARRCVRVRWCSFTHRRNTSERSVATIEFLDEIFLSESYLIFAIEVWIWFSCVLSGTRRFVSRGIRSRLRGAWNHFEAARRTPVKLDEDDRVKLEGNELNFR